MYKELALLSVVCVGVGPVKTLKNRLRACVDTTLYNYISILVAFVSPLSLLSLSLSLPLPLRRLLAFCKRRCGVVSSLLSLVLFLSASLPLPLPAFLSLSLSQVQYIHILKKVTRWSG